MDHAILDYRLHVPKSLVTKEHLDAYTHVIPKKNPMADSSIIAEDTETIIMYEDIHREGCYSFCRGDLGKIFELWPDLYVDDQRADVPMHRPLKFTGELRPNQEAALRQWQATGYGCLQAPARFGKTVTLVALICRLQQKTLVLTHQSDLLDQFRDTCYGNKRLTKAAMTNAGELCNVGIIEDWADIDRFDVCLLTYQRFVTGRNGPEMLQRLRNKFGLVIVDEVHRGSADCYSEVVNNLNPMFRIGVTATPFRKDFLHVVMEEIIGPVTSVGLSEQMVCTVNYVPTGYDPGVFHSWTTLENRLVKNDDRNKLIVDLIVERVMAGRNVIAVTNRKDHTKILSKMLRERDIASEAFNGSTGDRDGLLNRARNEKINVVIAMRKMVLGIDVPKWDSFFNLLPSANKFNYYQECSRIRTPYPGKPMPEIYDLVDDHAACYATKKTRDKVYKEQGFIINHTPSAPKAAKTGKWLDGL